MRTSFSENEDEKDIFLCACIQTEVKNAVHVTHRVFGVRPATADTGLAPSFPGRLSSLAEVRTTELC